MPFSRHGFSATGIWNLVLPVFPTIDATAVKSRLSFVPRLCYRIVVSIRANRADHSVFQSRLHFGSEDVAQNTTNQHRYENEEDSYEVLKM